MLYIIIFVVTDGFPSGQRGQTVNLLAPPSKVRILLHPANLALTSLRCGSYFFCAKRKPQRGRKAAAPLHTPRAFFKEFLVVDEGRGLTCACIPGYWMWSAVPIHSTTRRKRRPFQKRNSRLFSHIIRRKSKHRKRSIY